MLLRQQKWTLLICFSIHVLFLISIFDIYFKSPIVDGIIPLGNDILAPAKRLVLFIGDGLRSDSFFALRNNRSTAPYLRQVIEHRGRWGVSHTRVPTESRPGHIAIIAGFYEDPSAIFKGWKENPVDFDTVFNESVTTFGWGSPDILSMFNKGDSKLRVIMDSYDPKLEEFSGKRESAVLSSMWTLQKFKVFLDEATKNWTLREKLIQDKIIFFFHLLGIDTAGHSHKPHSKEYENNIRVTDDIVKQVEILVNNFYDNDNKTSFIFTSDHGMTDWGSHGEGSLDETETPFVAWGAGILNPSIIEKNSGTAEEWHLNHLQRNDMNQADIAPLMSILLGIPIPVNSLGTLPLDILNLSIVDKSRVILLNCRQILAQFLRKKEMVEKTTFKWLYKSYETLLGEANEILANLYSDLRRGSYDQVIEGSLKLISYSLAGLHYYHNYYQRLLLICTAAAYVGWISWLMLNVSFDYLKFSSAEGKGKKRGRFESRRFFILDSIFFCLIFIILFLLFAQSLPLQYYLYCCLPFIIWWSVLRKLIKFRSNFLRSQVMFSSVGVFLASAVGTEFVVIAFFERRALSFIILLLSAWPFLNGMNRSHFISSAWWSMSCFSLMIFPFLPIMKSQSNDSYLCACFVLWSIFIVISWYYLSGINFSIFCTKPKKLFLIPFVLFVITIFNVLFVSSSYSSQTELPVINKLLSWILLLTVPFIPLLYSRRLLIRLLNIYFSLGATSLLFSLNYDALFLPLFVLNLLLWFLMESYNDAKVAGENIEVAQLYSIKFYRKVNKDSRKLIADDFRTAYFFFFYMVFSFFGTGNLASINSFDTRWVRCFLTIFSPFTMMSLILVKMMIPFVVTACTFRAVNIITKVPVDKIFFIVLIYCDLMGLNFLFMVKNVGSWLEIGSSVSHYIISQTIILFLVLFYFLSSFLTSSKTKNFKSLFRTFRHSKTRYME